LRIAQSGLSQQVKALESSLRVRLFDRDARPIELTTAGEALLEEARRMLELADRTIERVRLPDAYRKTILKFGASSFGNGPIADEILRVARARLADVDLQVHLATTMQNMLELNRRALGVAFAYLPFESAEAPRFLPLGRVELMLALPEDHRLAVADRVPRAELLKEPLLVGPRSVNPLLADHVNRALLGRVEHPHPVEISDIGSARFRLVAEGVGISPVAFPTEALLPIRGVVYRRVEDPAPIIEYGLAWFDDAVSPALPAFLDVAREIAREASVDERPPLAV
jgi:DNA-binding transcriptional LysR family regulator